MDYRVLALKYRPRVFGELRGQETTVTALHEGLAAGRVANAYLFAGPRGVGKTSAARILARALNCLQAEGPSPDPCNCCENCVEILEGRSLDLIEVDGASNRRIEEVRDIRENSHFLPVKSRYKIYLIDEVHMLTEQAFSALLKTLEEPPGHTKFIFATTHPGKLPPTIISRCERYDFRLAPGALISEHLSEIARREGIEIEPAAVGRVSRAAAGSFRDGMSILDQVSSFRGGGALSLADVEKLLGLVPETVFAEAVGIILAGDRRGCLALLEKVSDSGHELAEFVNGLLEFVRYLVLFSHGAGSLVGAMVTPETFACLEALSVRLSPERWVALFEEISGERDKFRHDDLVRLRVEVSFLKIVSGFGPRENPAENRPAPVPARAAAVPPPEILAAPIGETRGAQEISPIPAAPIAETRGAREISPEQWRRFVGEAGAVYADLKVCLEKSRPEPAGRLVRGRPVIALATGFAFYCDRINARQAQLSELWSKLFGEEVLFEVRHLKGQSKAARQERAPADAEPGPVEAPGADQRAAAPPPAAGPELKPEEQRVVETVKSLFDGEEVA